MAVCHLGCCYRSKPWSLQFLCDHRRCWWLEGHFPPSDNLEESLDCRPHPLLLLRSYKGWHSDLGRKGWSKSLWLYQVPILWQGLPKLEPLLSFHQQSCGRVWTKLLEPERQVQHFSKSSWLEFLFSDVHWWHQWPLHWCHTGFDSEYYQSRQTWLVQSKVYNLLEWLSQSEDRFCLSKVPNRGLFGFLQSGRYHPYRW